MAEMSVIWLRGAAVLYALGLLHAFLTLTRKREGLFGVALGAFAIGAVLQFVSILEEGLIQNRCPVGNFYDTLSMCSFLIAVLFLFIYWRYRVESISVFIFPLVFMMTLLATLGNPVGGWSSPALRSAWLTVHTSLVLLGYAALLFASSAAVLYLFEERELKSKKPRKFYYRLPPLATLDELISRSMALGFVLITLAIIAGTTWAFVELRTNWIGDPKVMIAFVTWGIYMAAVFFRVTAGWRGRKFAIMAVMALSCSALTWAAHAGLGRVLLNR